VTTPERTEISDEMEERRWYINGYRSAAGRNAAAYGLTRSPDNRWFIEIWLPNEIKRKLFGVPDYESGMRAQDYCAKHDTLVKIALIHLDQGEPEQMSKLRRDAIELGELPNRRMRLTLDIEVVMRGTNDQISYYVESLLRGSSSVTGAKTRFIEGPELKEPRPTVEYD
jgi:hypothetical protein